MANEPSREEDAAEAGCAEHERLEEAPECSPYELLHGRSG